MIPAVTLAWLAAGNNKKKQASALPPSWSLLQDYSEVGDTESL